MLVIVYSASLSIVTPFYSACLVETVQSNVASEKTVFYDVFKEGLIRLLRWNCPQKGKFNIYFSWHINGLLRNQECYVKKIYTKKHKKFLFGFKMSLWNVLKFAYYKI